MKLHYLCLSLVSFLSLCSAEQVTGLFLGDAVSSQVQINQNRYFAASIPSTTNKNAILIVDVIAYAKLAENTKAEVISFCAKFIIIIKVYLSQSPLPTSSTPGAITASQRQVRLVSNRT